MFFQKPPNLADLHLWRVIFILRIQNFETSKNHSPFPASLPFQRKNPAPKCGIFACIFFVNATWCARRDSNPRPHGPEYPSEFTTGVFVSIRQSFLRIASYLFYCLLRCLHTSFSYRGSNCGAGVCLLQIKLALCNTDHKNI